MTQPPRKPSPPIPELMVAGVALVAAGLAAMILPAFTGIGGGWFGWGIVLLFVGGPCVVMSLPDKEWRPDDFER